MNTEEKILAMLEKLNGTVEKHGEVLDKVNTRMASLETGQAQMQATLTRVAVTQENIVLKGLDALAEGQDLTYQRIKGLAGKDELAELREEMLLLRSVVAQHTRDIETLKAAQ